MQVSAVLTKGARRLHPTTAENAGVHIQGVGGGSGGGRVRRMDRLKFTTLR